MAGPCVGAPGSLIAPGRTVTWAVDGGPVVAAGLPAAELAWQRRPRPRPPRVAAVTAVMQAARVILALCMDSTIVAHIRVTTQQLTGYQPSGPPGCGWKS